VVVAFVDAHKDTFGVEPICRVLRHHGVAKIAPSSYYAFKSRPPSPRSLRDAELLVEIRRVHADRALGRGLYGAQKVWRQLRREGIAVARCTVERLMRRAGLRGVRRGRQFVTTRPDAAATRPPDRVNRNFHAERPNALWVVDFTYVPCWSGMVFTAFVSDVFSRRIVGWRVATSMPTALPLDALEMALWIRARAGESVDGLIHHSDAGSQYTAIRYAERLLEAGALASIGTVGDSFDNALAESVVGLYKTECVRRDGPFRGVDGLELATADWVWWFNHSRLHGSIGHVPPVEFEAAYYTALRDTAA
jgi:putative transposase